MRSYDIAFIGHMCFDEMVPFDAAPYTSPGSAVWCGAFAAAGVGKRVLVVTRMNPGDEDILRPMRDAGIDVHLVPAEQTSRIQVVHPCADVDVRELVLRHNAGFFQPEDVPEIDAQRVHLAGISDREFTLDFMAALRARGYALSVDMQSFVRQADPVTGQVTFGDVSHKTDIVSLMDRVKLDIVEARLLTGKDDLEQAAMQFEAWGSEETLVTAADGVLARAGAKTWFERFSNCSVAGRTGRGDTTFAGYLARRLDHDVPTSLRFAAALVSIKMETPGPFKGTLEDVLTRLRESHSPA